MALNGQKYRRVPWRKAFSFLSFPPFVFPPFFLLFRENPLLKKFLSKSFQNLAFRPTPRSKTIVKNSIWREQQGKSYVFIRASIGRPTKLTRVHFCPCERLAGCFRRAPLSGPVISWHRPTLDRLRSLRRNYNSAMTRWRNPRWQSLYHWSRAKRMGQKVPRNSFIFHALLNFAQCL